MALQLLVIAILAIASARRSSPDTAAGPLAFRRLGEVAMIACGMVLLSPMSSKSHFCVLLLPVSFCAAAFLYRGRKLALGILLVAVFAVGTLSSKGLVGREIGQVLLACGSVTWTAMLCLVATAGVLWQGPELNPSARPAKP